MLLFWLWMSGYLLTGLSDSGPDRIALNPDDGGVYAAEDGTPQPPPKP